MNFARPNFLLDEGAKSVGIVRDFTEILFSGRSWHGRCDGGGGGLEVEARVEEGGGGYESEGGSEEG